MEQDEILWNHNILRLHPVGGHPDRVEPEYIVIPKDFIRLGHAVTGHAG